MSEVPAPVPGVYLAEDKTSGIEARTLKYFGDSPSTAVVVSDQAAGGVVFLRRTTVKPGKEVDPDEDVLLARIGLGGNMYLGGSLEVDGDVVFTGGVFAGSLEGGPGKNAFDLRTWEKGPGDSRDVFLKHDYDRVGIGITEPQHALHVKGTVAAEKFKGKIGFSDVTHVPVARQDVPSLVQLSDAVDEKDSTRAASLLAVQQTHAALEDRVAKSGDTMHGSLHIKDSRLTVSGNGARLGVNNRNPTHQLDVIGDINFTGRLMRDGKEQQIERVWELTTEDNAFFPKSVGIGIPTPDKTLHVDGDIESEGKVFTHGLIVVDPESGEEQHADDRYRLMSDTVKVEGGGTGSEEQMDGRILIGSGKDPIFAVPELFWDRPNLSLGIRTNVPKQALHIEGNVQSRNVLSHRLVLSTGVPDGDIGPIDGDGNMNDIYSTHPDRDKNDIDTDLGQFLPTDVVWDNDEKILEFSNLEVDTVFLRKDRKTRIHAPLADTMAFVTDDNERMRITSRGRVGINTTDPMYDLDVRGDIAYQSAFELSDAKVKRDIRPIDNALETLKQLEGVRYHRTDTITKERIGFIAQQVLNTLPEVVEKDEHRDMLSVSYGNIVAVVTEAVKELDKKYEEKINHIMDELARLKTKHVYE